MKLIKQKMNLQNLKDNTEFLTLKHYKEPLIKLKDGYGYLGALSVTMDGDKVQCHICGELFRCLSMHVYQTHEMLADDYRDKFGLAHTTSLISETEREKRKQRTLYWLNNATEEEIDMMVKKRKAREKEGIKRRGNFQPKIRLETKNKRGTCPDQLLEKINEVRNKLGHTPSKIEFIEACESQRYVHLIYKTFGSWTEAVRKAGNVPRENSTTKGQIRKRYTNDELLEYITLYYQENGKIPTHTDCKRGLLPSYEVYQRRFGSFPKARELAGIIE